MHSLDLFEYIYTVIIYIYIYDKYYIICIFIQGGTLVLCSEGENPHPN